MFSNNTNHRNNPTSPLLMEPYPYSLLGPPFHPPRAVNLLNDENSEVTLTISLRDGELTHHIKGDLSKLHYMLDSAMRDKSDLGSFLRQAFSNFMQAAVETFEGVLYR